METTSDRLKRAMEIRGLKQADLIERTGITKGALSSYVSGSYKPKQKNTYLLAKALDVSEAWLMGADVPMDKSDAALPPIPNAKGVKKIRLPKLGVTAAGEPTFAEYSDEYVEVDFDIKADFALDVKGDSMHPDIQNGDIVFVRSQPEARNGQIAIIMIDGEVTVKVFYKDAHAITLMPKNAAYPPTIITNVDGRDVRILGVVVRSCRNYL